MLQLLICRFTECECAKLFGLSQLSLLQTQSGGLHSVHASHFGDVAKLMHSVHASHVGDVAKLMHSIHA